MMKGIGGETQRANRTGEHKVSTKPGVGSHKARVYNPLFLVQLCSDTLVSERSWSLTHSEEDASGLLL